MGSSFIHRGTSRRRRLARVATCAYLVITIVGHATSAGDPAHAVAPPGSSEAREEIAPNPPPSRDLEPTADDLAGTPVPGEESGRLDEIDPGDAPLRVLARGVLFVPKLAASAALTPIRTAIWAQNRYQLDELYDRTFFNRDRTIGLHPLATYETGSGFTAGARFVARDLFGQREHLGLQATTGAVAGISYRDSVMATLRTGRRLGTRLELGISANMDRRPDDRFHGIGNGDLVAAMDAPIGPGDAAVVGVTHRYRERRAVTFVDARPFDAVHVRASGALTELAFARSDRGPAIDVAYDPACLVGFEGVRHAYAELELRFDERHPATIWEPTRPHARGWLASGFAGRVHRLDAGVDFWRGGIELQRFWPLGTGPRVLATRFHAEAVSAGRDEVPFTELPALGGGAFLRGYPFGRFRDRVATLATVAYEWDLSHHLSASVFVDAGRVFASLSAVELRGFRAGYGASIALFRGTGLVLEATVASSIDGGLQSALSFNSVFDARPRWR